MTKRTKIYLFSEGQYENRYVTAVFEAPEGVDISYQTFLSTLGVRPFPHFSPSRDVMDWDADLKQWLCEKESALTKAGIQGGEAEDRAYRQWLEAHPCIRSVSFEELN